MKPTYDELLMIVESQRKEIKELRTIIGQQNKRITRLENELQKYHNENTPSGALPPYLKELEKNVKNMTKDKGDDDPPKENVRNARSKHIDRKEYHDLEDTNCPNCGKKLTKKTATRKRIVIEMPIPNPETVEHELALYYCKNCGKNVSAEVPNALPKAKFDIVTLILLSYFNVGLNLSEENITNLLRDIFHIHISKGTVSNNLMKLKEYLGDNYSELEKNVKSAAVRYKDETSVRCNGETFWMWVVSTAKGVLYLIDKSRGSKVANRLSSTAGVDVCDGYRAYDKYITRQRCWAHVFRRLRKPIYDFGDYENYGEYKNFAFNLCILFSDAKTEKRKCAPSKRLREKYERRLWNLLESIKDKNGRNTVRVTNYILKYFNDLFTFLEYKDVEPTNNEAERALRHFVVKRKVSQQFKSVEGIQSYERQLSLFMTSKTLEQSYIGNLHGIIDSKMDYKR